jgi:hypothetical protein
MAADPIIWPEDQRHARVVALRDERHRLDTVQRAEDAYDARVDAAHARRHRRALLVAEFAAIAEEMVAIGRREELSPQQVAAARDAVRRAGRALALMEEQGEGGP